MDSTEDGIVTQSTPIINMIYEDLYDQMRKKKVIERKDLGLMNKIKLRHLGKLNAVIKSNLRDEYRRSQEIAKNEIFKNSFSLKKEYAEPLAADEFLKVIDDETFQYIEKWHFNVMDDAKRAMQQALKDGRPLSSVIAMLEGDPFLKISPIDGDIEKIATPSSLKSKDKSMVSLRRYARTKSTEVLNRARLDYFTNSNIVAGYQYSAILDGRTTIVCAGLHGKKFKAGSQPNPPLHFNCRSIILPITVFEEFKEDSKVGGTVKTKRAGDIKVPNKTIDQHLKDNVTEKGFSIK
jgi:SPP1 gp7 family putative phage head morphogenesis protein